MATYYDIRLGFEDPQTSGADSPDAALCLVLEGLAALDVLPLPTATVTGYTVVDVDTDDDAA